MRSPVFLLLIVAGTTAAALALLPVPTLEGLFREGGSVENFQAFSWALCAALSLVYWLRKQWSGGLIGAFLLVMLLVRELDFHKRFTAMSVTRTRYYLLPDVPVLTRLIAATVVLGTLAVAIVFLRKHLRLFWNALRSGRKWACSAAAGIGAITVAFLVDKLHGWEGHAVTFLRVLGLTPVPSEKLLQIVIEESVELAAPMLFLLALIQFGRQVGADSTGEPWTSLERV
jgi:hypothetical protein